MHFSTLVTAASAAGMASAAAFKIDPSASAKREAVSKRHVSRQESNPFTGRTITVNPDYAEKLEDVVQIFEAAGDETNVAKTRVVQDIGTFFWISNIASLENIDEAIEIARAARDTTGEEQIVGLVVYNLPDRDCSGGESSGELESENGGLDRYKAEYIAPYAEKVGAASDLTFALVVEPDAVGNIVTNQGTPFCQTATPVYEEGIAHAISELQFPHVFLYLDASHGGWLGWDDNLEPTAQQFAKIVALAQGEDGGNSTSPIRGFSTNVSNYNPFYTTDPPPYTEGSNAYDEGSFATVLAPHLEEAGLPSNFIIDQGRVALPGAREEWGEWCNVAPAGYGQIPGPPTPENPYVDSIVWIKPGGESDGQCGYEGSPVAGAWFPEYAALLVENADPSISA